MDYPKITTCTRCGGQRWDGPAPVCAICAINIEEQERQDRRRIAAQERVKLAADLLRGPED